MKISVISCSLHPLSRSFLMAEQAMKNFEEQGVDARLYDLREYDLDFCGRPEARDNPSVAELRSAVRDASAVVVAVPIYNFYVNAATKI